MYSAAATCLDNCFCLIHQHNCDSTDIDLKVIEISNYITTLQPSLQKYSCFNFNLSLIIWWILAIGQRKGKALYVDVCHDKKRKVPTVCTTRTTERMMTLFSLPLPAINIREFNDFFIWMNITPNSHNWNYRPGIWRQKC